MNKKKEPPHRVPDGEELEKITSECAICHSLEEARIALQRIANNIDMSCISKSRKKDFGLEKSFVEAQISVITRMVKFHQYYHSTGQSLNDGDFGLNLGNETHNANPNFRRFRPK